MEKTKAHLSELTVEEVHHQHRSVFQANLQEHMAKEQAEEETDSDDTDSGEREGGHSQAW